ncbi:hypothetical protein [Streptomyces sp. 8P21H-1]|uniref:hypothetical protein n=1 Tax=Streptomyces sp. 8P21H-1 TaxID=2737048 RepID=UPI00156F27D8|nr:hypothetical protein [Streptomyces sp. 8P21H-1]NSL43896.1 hypothetical protein [Streptomyces sp. 8P21H-1]
MEPARQEPRSFWEHAQETFQAHRLGVLIIGATAVVGLLATAVGLVFSLFPDLQPKPESKSSLEIENVAVGGITEIHGRTEVPEAETYKRTFEAPVVAIALSNDGDKTAYVKSGKFTFFAARDMAECSRIGGGNIDYVNFDVNVPATVKSGDTLEKTTFFQVRPKKSESLTFSLGPAGSSVSEYWVYGFSLELTTGSGSVSVPRTAVSNVELWSKEVLQWAAQQTAPSEPYAEDSRKCYTRTLDIVNKVIEEAEPVPAGLQESP